MEWNFEYIYNIKDYLGNVRGSFSDNGLGDVIDFVVSNSEKKDIRILIVHGDGKDDLTKNSLDANEIILQWNPDIEVAYLNYDKKTETSREPPMQTLAHELGHAKNWLENPEAYRRRPDKEDNKYFGYDEEEYNIEKKKNRLLLYRERTTHFGRSYPSDNLFYPSTSPFY